MVDAGPGRRPPGHRWRGARRLVRVRQALAAMSVIAVFTAGLSGCIASATAAPIQLGSAYVPAPQAPGTTVAYVVIRNNGDADRLVSARTSVGGRVVFRAPLRPHATTMRTVPALAIPAHATFSMIPDGYHLLITGAGPMPDGKDISLTLVFARAGPLTVQAQVVNPQADDNGYFVN